MMMMMRIIDDEVSRSHRARRQPHAVNYRRERLSPLGARIEVQQSPFLLSNAMFERMFRDIRVTHDSVLYAADSAASRIRAHLVSPSSSPASSPPARLQRQMRFLHRSTRRHRRLIRSTIRFWSRFDVASKSPALMMSRHCYRFDPLMHHVKEFRDRENETRDDPPLIPFEMSNAINAHCMIVRSLSLAICMI